MEYVKMGAIAGFFAGVAYGVFLGVGWGYIPAIPGRMAAGVPLFTGWVAFFLTSIVLGMVFAFLVRKPAWSVPLGLVYGAVLWLVFPHTLMPVEVGRPHMVWFPSPAISLAGFLGYGFILGASYFFTHSAYTRKLEP
jgi:hypothetical protein